MLEGIKVHVWQVDRAGQGREWEGWREWRNETEMTLSTRLMGSRNVNVERRITNMVAKPQGTLRETAGKREWGVAGGWKGGEWVIESNVLRGNLKMWKPKLNLHQKKDEREKRKVKATCEKRLRGRQQQQEEAGGGGWVWPSPGGRLAAAIVILLGENCVDVEEGKGVHTARATTIHINKQNMFTAYAISVSSRQGWSLARVWEGCRGSRGQLLEGGGVRGGGTLN